MSDVEEINLNIEEWNRRYIRPLREWSHEIAWLRMDILQRRIERADGMARWRELLGRHEQLLEELRRTRHMVEVSARYVSVSGGAPPTGRKV